MGKRWGARSSSRTQTAVCAWNPECAHVSIPAAWSSSNRAKRMTRNCAERWGAPTASSLDLYC